MKIQEFNKGREQVADFIKKQQKEGIANDKRVKDIEAGKIEYGHWDKNKAKVKRLLAKSQKSKPKGAK